MLVGSDFSGVGAFNQALKRLGIDYEEVFACDMDKHARKTFIHNYGEPKYYPENVYDREIPTESLDIYMTSPPCQSFSLAGKRKGEQDERGILFYNSHEFIKVNKPRYFIFENVKGLLSDNGGKTFGRWIELLGGKSVNGNQVIFTDENSAPYHIYWKVLNAKNYGVPQNRERVFIIGIRDDADNNFNFPKPFELKKRLKDVLEENVNEKYYLSEKLISWITSHREKRESKNAFPMNKNGINGCITARYFKTGAEDPYVQTFDTPKVKLQLTGGKWDKTHEQSGRVYDENGISPTIHTMGGGGQEPKVAIGAIRGRNPDNPISRQSGLPTQQMLEVNENGTSNCLTTVQKDNVVVEQFRIRKLTPRECFRLMDFPDSFDFSVVSDSQAYKQAGNSIVVNVLCELIKKLNY